MIHMGDSLHAKMLADHHLIFVTGKITDFSNADVAVDQYHRYQVSNDRYH